MSDSSAKKTAFSVFASPVTERKLIKIGREFKYSNSFDEVLCYYIFDLYNIEKQEKNIRIKWREVYIMQDDVALLEIVSLDNWIRKLFDLSDAEQKLKEHKNTVKTLKDMFTEFHHG